MMANSVTAIVALLQMGVLEIHPVGIARGATSASPDRIIFDLDPDETVPWEDVKEAVLVVKTLLENIGLAAFLKTTGGKGLHVVVAHRAHARLGPGQELHQGRRRAPRADVSRSLHGEAAQGLAARQDLHRLPAQRRGRDRGRRVFAARARRMRRCRRRSHGTSSPATCASSISTCRTCRSACSRRYDPWQTLAEQRWRSHLRHGEGRLQGELTRSGDPACAERAAIRTRNGSVTSTRKSSPRARCSTITPSNFDRRDQQHVLPDAGLGDARAMGGTGPDHFTFTLKAPRRITHEQRLRESESNVADSCERATVLGDKLGALLFQLPPFLKKDLPRLRRLPRAACPPAGASPSNSATIRGRTTKCTRRLRAAARSSASPIPTKATRRSSSRPIAVTCACAGRTTTIASSRPGPRGSPPGSTQNLRVFHARGRSARHAVCATPERSLGSAHPNLAPGSDPARM